MFGSLLSVLQVSKSFFHQESDSVLLIPSFSVFKPNSPTLRNIEVKLNDFNIIKSFKEKIFPLGSSFYKLHLSAS